MFNSRRYTLNRLLWVMKTARSWMNKVDSEIREAVRLKGLTEDTVDWLCHAGQIKGAADVCLKSWIDELQRIYDELNEELKNSNQFREVTKLMEGKDND